MYRFFQALVVMGALLAAFSIALVFQSFSLHSSGTIAQNTNTYLGPKQKAGDSAKLIKVQVILHDDPKPGGVQIESAQFNGIQIPLQPRDVHGFRGQASFQVLPGRYKLKWKVRIDRLTWPRTADHEEEVYIDPRDLWLQITIDGDNASLQ